MNVFNCRVQVHFHPPVAHSQQVLDGAKLLLGNLPVLHKLLSYICTPMRAKLGWLAAHHAVRLPAKLEHVALQPRKPWHALGSAANCEVIQVVYGCNVLSCA